MSRTISLALATFTALALQPALNEALRGSPLMISLPILVAALAMFLCGPAEGLAWAGFAGLISDALHAPPMGVDMFCLTLLSFAIRRMAGTSLPRSIVFAAAASGALTFCTILTSAALRGLWMRTPLVGGPLLALALRVALGNMLVAIVAVILWRLLPQRFTARTPRRAFPVLR